MAFSSGGFRPKPRRRSELGLLIVGAIAILYATLLPGLASANSLPAHEYRVLIGFLGAICFIQVVNRRLVPDADPVILPIALVLNGLGYVMIARLTPDPSTLTPDEAGPQFEWTLIGLVVYLAMLLVIRRSRDLERYRYLMLVAAFALLVAPILPVIGYKQNGARLWVHFHRITFQPVEVAKILLVIFFASYFIEKRELLTVPTRRVGNHLLPDLRAFGPIAVAAVLSLFVILGEHDIGFAVLLFVVFLSMLWISTGRWTHLAIGLVAFIAAIFLASHLLTQVNERITDWLNPWPNYNGTGYQPIQGEFAFARGGLYGSGLGLGIPGVIPVNTSDFIFAAIGEELGLFGTGAVVVAFLLLIGAGMRIALQARSEFSKLCATGLTVLIGFQAFFIMAGVTRLLPLTGVTLPFISYGGSSLVANYALLAILMRISDEGNQPAGTPRRSRSVAATVIGAGRP